MIEAIFFVFFMVFVLSLIVNSSYFYYIPNMIYNIINKNSNIDMKNKLLDAVDTKWIYDDDTFKKVKQN
jgi:hypothetical protein